MLCKLKFKLVLLCFVLSLLFLGFEVKAQTLEYDLGITAGDIFFSKSVLISGQPVRIYAAIRNYGTRDVTGYALFYAGPNLIGESQIVSVRAGGYSDEVFVDWAIPEGSFNIRVDIRGQTPGDENPVNDSALSALFNPEKDTDGDGIIDKNDNCVNVSNPDQGDVDGDGIGDVCDPDDDNDGLPDGDEGRVGTNPVDPDSDDDGVLDGQDNCPLIANPGQEDKDKDGKGDACDSTNNNAPPASPAPQDQDGDGIPDSRDNCKTVANASQTDTDQDGLGDACDPDDDNDGLSDQDEKSLGTNPKNPDTDNDQVNDKEDSEPLNPNVGTAESAAAREEGDEWLDLITLEPGEIDQKGLKNVAIDFVKINSNTYLFKAGVMSIGSEDLKYEWDFGDGTKSDQKEVKYTFHRSGLYKVVLKVSDQSGNSKEVKTEIKINFFDLDHPFLFSGLLGGLLLGGAAWHVRKKRKAMLDVE